MLCVAAGAQCEGAREDRMPDPALLFQYTGVFVEQRKLAGVGADHDTVAVNQRLVGVAGGVESPAQRAALRIQAIDAIAAVILIPARAAGGNINTTVL